MRTPRTYAGFALDEIARHRLRRARREAALAQLAEIIQEADEAELQHLAGTVTRLHRELPYPDGPLASRAVTSSDEVEGHSRP